MKTKTEQKLSTDFDTRYEFYDAIGDACAAQAIGQGGDDILAITKDGLEALKIHVDMSSAQFQAIEDAIAILEQVDDLSFGTEDDEDADD